MAARKTAHLTEVPAPRSTRIMTCANHKGGTGKTTTAVNVSAGLALLTQQRVLLIDCDPRGHASLALGIDTKHVRYSVTDLLMEPRPRCRPSAGIPAPICTFFRRTRRSPTSNRSWCGVAMAACSCNRRSTPSWTPSM